MSHKEKKKRKKKYRGFWLFVKLQIVLILLVIGGLAYYYFGGYASQVSAMHEEAVRFVKESTKDTFRAEQTSQVYDVNGTRIMSLRGTKDVSYLTSDEIPEEVKEAMADQPVTFVLQKIKNFTVMAESILRQLSVQSGQWCVTEK